MFKGIKFAINNQKIIKMNTTPLSNKPVTDDNGQSPKSKWTRTRIAAALATGAITVEAANILYAQLELTSEPEPIPEPEANLEEDAETTLESAYTETSYLTSEPTPTSEAIQESIQEPYPEPIPEPLPDLEPTPETDEIIEVIVEEIDPLDIDMEDILQVDEIGTVYTVDGRELNAAVIHDNQGNQAVIVDVDGDHVYDVITTPQGEVITQVPGDIDVSDVELLYAQQHGHAGYIAPNRYDIAMHVENSGTESDTALS